MKDEMRGQSANVSRCQIFVLRHVSSWLWKYFHWIAQHTTTSHVLSDAAETII